MSLFASVIQFESFLLVFSFKVRSNFIGIVNNSMFITVVAVTARERACAHQCVSAIHNSIHIRFLSSNSCCNLFHFEFSVSVVIR